MASLFCGFDHNVQYSFSRVFDILISMIENIVFDVGNVLATFQPKEFLNDFYKDPKIAQDLFKLFFESKLWNAYDQGVYSGNTLKAEAIKRMPMYKKEIEGLIPTWASYVHPFDKSISLMKQLKKEGYGIYILSNIPEDSYRYFIENDNIFESADGGIYSYQDQLIKPDPAIFKLLLERYHLNAKTCLFIDDKKENTQAAQKLGFHVITLRNPEEIEKEVRNKIHEV